MIIRPASGDTIIIMIIMIISIVLEAPIPWCTETWRTNKGFTEEVIFPY